MSFDEFTYDRIEAYLNGEMSSEERAVFEKEMSADQHLTEQVDKYTFVNKLVLENRLLSVKEIFQQEHARATEKPSYSKYVYAVIAAAVVVGAAVSVWLYNNGQTRKQQETLPAIETAPDHTASNTIQTKKSESGTHARTDAEQTIEPTHLRKQDVQLIEEQNKLNVPSVERNIVQEQKMEASSIQKTEHQPEEKNTQAETTKDICAGVVIKADIKTSSTCLHESTGNVMVYNIHGGTKPYKVSVLNAHKEFAANGELAKGIYQIQITDANTCEKIYSPVEITAKDCPMDYSFNPFIGEKWHIESHSSSGQLEIYNKAGVLHYKANLDANSENEWTGAGFNNQLMPGYYIFVIKYADGTMKKGSVTVVQ